MCLLEVRRKRSVNSARLLIRQADYSAYVHRSSSCKEWQRYCNDTPLNRVALVSFACVWFFDKLEVSQEVLWVKSE